MTLQNATQTQTQTPTQTRSRSGTSHVGRAGVIAAVVGVTLAVACSVNVDIANKACASDGACGTGYVCDNKVCVLPQDVKPATTTGDGGVVPTCDPCSCTGDVDCKNPAKPRCSPIMKVCVECTQTPSDNCRAGQFCNGALQCILGCKQESDCAISSNSPHCDATRHQCVQCSATIPCTDPLKKCSQNGSCVDSCATAPCTTAGTDCCGGLCLDYKTDTLNCGACNKRCSSANGTPKCVDSKCDSDCAAGFASCDPANLGACETNIRTLTHCGSCTGNCDKIRNAADLTCATGSCTYTTCAAGFVDADNDKSNGCELACGKLGQPCCPTGVVCTEGTCKPPAPNQCR